MEEEQPPLAPAPRPRKHFPPQPPIVFPIPSFRSGLLLIRKCLSVCSPSSVRADRCWSTITSLKAVAGQVSLAQELAQGRAPTLPWSVWL